jgi:acetaldehyde dehydrogenase (acetylating)
MIKISIIGTGQIGYDLLHKIIKLDFVKIVAFVGRRAPTKKIPDSIKYSNESINFFISNPKCCDVVFDCTDAFSAKINSSVFIEQGIQVIDLTPSNIGDFYVPNITEINTKNINMITCGGQISIPIIKYFKDKIKNISYVEVVTQINSESAGIATRINIDNYIETTEMAIYKIANVENNKVILNINPHTNIMQTTIFIKTNYNFIAVDDFIDFNKGIERIQEYAPNYTVSKPEKINENVLMINITMLGSNNIISISAGNLEIINCAAINALLKIHEQIQIT